MQPILEDVKVLDLSHTFAGPYCSTVLADYGAQVIKTEPPRSGDIACCQAIEFSMMERRPALLGTMFRDYFADGEIPGPKDRSVHLGVAANVVTFPLWVDSGFAITAYYDVSGGRATY